MAVGEMTATGVGPVRAAVECVRAAVAGFDPALVLTRDAMVLVDLFGEIERMGGAGKALAARRVSESEQWRRLGYRSPAEWLAAKSGTKVGEAIGVLETAQAMEGLDATTEVFKAGKLSSRQAKAVATAAKADPHAEADLLRIAAGGSVKDLESKSREVRHAASTESVEQRHARLHEERSVRAWLDPESGAGRGEWTLPPAEHARFMARLNREKDRIFRDARREGRVESQDAYAADALMALVGSGVGGGAGPGSVANVEIIVRVDEAPLVRGHTEPGEQCEIAGIGPVPVSVVREWIGRDAFKAAIVADGVDITSLVHLGRKPIALQRTALAWTHGLECSVEGCNATVGLEIDHVRDWATSHRTTLDELTFLCPHHHGLKTNPGYTVGPLQPDGKRRLIAPPSRPDLFDSS